MVVAGMVSQNELVQAVSNVLDDIEYSGMAETLYSILAEAYEGGNMLLENNAVEIFNEIAQQASQYLEVDVSVDFRRVAVKESGGGEYEFILRGYFIVDDDTYVELVLRVTKDMVSGYIYA